VELNLKNKLYLVTGASSGFGAAVAKALLAERAKVLVNARREEELIKMTNIAPGQIEYLAGDVTQFDVQDDLFKMLGDRKLEGAFINAGGPPAKGVLETQDSDWDEAYRSLLRWKVRMSKILVNSFIKNGGGKLLFLESISVKQPVTNLVLSNSMRMAVVGFVKTFADEVGDKGISMNIIAPGYHDTAAMQRIIKKKAETNQISYSAAKDMIENEVKTGKMGNPKDLASLVVWLFSEHADYITGQTISVDGGLVKGAFG
jgi:3-oxoacyl-[acyl-carrier protein] reductase